MAKELPFFKFEPNRWENGSIQMLSREDKGLFVDICSVYWSRLGDLPEKLVLQKLCGGYAAALKPLYDEEIIECIDGKIYIKFLSVQLQEFENTSSINSKNAKEGWEKRRRQKEESARNATASNSQSEIDGIREEKRREEKIREENKPTVFSFFNSLISEGATKELSNQWIEVRKRRKAVNTQTAFDGFLREYKKTGLEINTILTICCENSWSGFKKKWLDNDPSILKSILESSDNPNQTQNKTFKLF